VSLPEPGPQVGQRHLMPGWPTEPTAVELYKPSEVELYDRGPIVHIPDPYNPHRFIEVRRSDIRPMQPQQPRDLTPQPLFDPGAQKIAAGGVLAAGAGWGGGQFLVGASQFGSVLAGASTSVMWLVGAFVVSRITSAMAGRGSTHIEQHVHHHQKWFGRSTTNL
jgi:hypothetical protein